MHNQPLYLLFPGRHIINTRFQQEYLFDVLKLPLDDLPFLHRSDKLKGKSLEHLLFAITSSNQENSRYNPIPFHVRAISVDRFAKSFKELGVDYEIFGIPHFAYNEHFAQYVLKEIVAQTEGRLQLTPRNTVVLSSTPSIIQQYLHQDFSVLPAELSSMSPELYHTQRPPEVLQSLVHAGNTWKGDRHVRRALSPSTISTLSDFPDMIKRITRLYNDPFLNDEGSLTDTRDYTSYAIGMASQDILNIKYQDIKDAIKDGKIVDEGCADGALLIPVARDFQDSDLIGVEITGEFISRAKERQRVGEYGGTFIHFAQRNILSPLFPDNTIDTTICNSTLHELWSYGNQEESLLQYLQLKYKQLRKGGRLIIRDVVGPEDKNTLVHMLLNKNDGLSHESYQRFEDPKQLAHYLQSLSTEGRFQRFSHDYLSDMRQKNARSPQTQVRFDTETLNNQLYYVLSLKDATEFMTKKEYVDNWQSEMNEEFAFFSFSDWKNMLKKVGFSIIENPNDPSRSSRAYTNPWIVENRWKDKVTLYTKENESLKHLDYPVTNMVLIGEK